MSDVDAPQTSPPPEPRMSGFKKRLPILLVLGALLLWAARNTPVETTLVYALGGKANGLTALEIEILEDDGRALVRKADFRYSDQAPGEQTHTLRLTRGAYAIEATLHHGDRVERVERLLRFDGEERVVLSL